jgi:hypothetical protein
MRPRLIVLSLALVAAAPLLTAASPFADAARRLDGEWRGDGYVLRIDSQRAQASLDPERPFQWQRFIVKEVTDDEIVFSIGAELFEASVDADRLVLTGTSFRGEAEMIRWKPPAELELRPSTN